MRTLANILRHPLNDDEERLADEHIRQACDQIQQTWNKRERAKREVQRCGLWRAPTVEWIGDED